MVRARSNEAASGSRDVSPLLRSKLRPPAVPEYFVPRARLDNVLDDLTTRPLTLVIAPAGSGKTQFLANWVSTTSEPVAWLSLEEMDDDPVELWSGMMATLDSLSPGCGDAARRLLASSAPIGDVVRALLQSLESVSVAHSVLVIDDVHHVRDSTTADSLSLFVQHLPRWLHVVIAGRADPHLPLDRLRARGQLDELRFPDLQLTPAEARQVLQRLAPDLSESEIEESARSTDGWAAGVQLTGLAARTAHVKLSPTSLRPDVQLLTEDYVWHEVLATADPDVVDVLLQISVVDRVNSALATAITGRADVRDLLLRGEAQGQFVYRIGGEGWFRIHPFVRQALLNELVRSSRHLPSHERAALWLEHADETVIALEQWLLAERPREALRLLGAKSTQLYDQGREGVIMRTVEAIPMDVAAADVPSLIDFAIGHIVGSRAKFIAAVRQAVWRAGRTQHDLSPQLDALQAISWGMTGNWTRGAESARRSLGDLGDSWWSDPAVRFSWNTAARCLALTESWDDDDPFLVDATIATSRDPRRGISLEGVRALGHAFAGRPIDALRVAGGVRHAAATMSILRVELAIAEAVSRREIGDRERAIAELQVIADDATEPRLYCPIAAMLSLASIAADAGDIETAAHELARAESLMRSADGGPDLEQWINRAATTLALAAGNIDEATRTANAIADPFWGPVCRTRVHLALGGVDAAMTALAAAEPRCPRHRVTYELLTARVVPLPDDVLGHVTTAVELASSHGMLQTVVDNGRELMDVIERTAWAVSEEWLQRLRLAMAPNESRLQLPTREFIEPLTDRERDVLRLLPSRLTLSEIAKELYVSVNTLKFHLRVIYRKLGVNSRDEAAAVARSMTRVASAGSR